MKFNIVAKPEPENGAEKVVVKFALYPERIDNDTVIWLERYVCLYKYDERHNVWHLIGKRTLR